ncbi:MAG TPA: polysaccharide deacetylase family protein [Acidothermaceae bacterium]
MNRRRFLASLGLLGVGSVAGAGVGFVSEPAFAAESPTARTSTPGGKTAAYRADVAFRAAPSEKLVALTIDDGPTAQWTPKVLALLRRRGVVATFFLVGRRLAADPTPTARAADAGHEFANHTWAHTDVTHHDEAFIYDSLERTHELVEKITGRAPTLFRPPYGRIDSVGLAACARLEYGVALWSDHVTGSNPSGDVDTTLRQASPGSIVLAHDGGPEPNDNLMAQLDRLVGGLLDDGYRFATVSQLLAAPSVTPGAAPR